MVESLPAGRSAPIRLPDAESRGEMCYKAVEALSTASYLKVPPPRNRPVTPSWMVSKVLALLETCSGDCTVFLAVRGKKSMRGLLVLAARRRGEVRVEFCCVDAAIAEPVCPRDIPSCWPEGEEVEVLVYTRRG